ncbi:hypothetical protein IHN57_02435, partial [Deinococcus sp. 6GRE01]|nr:hypothetical protein [Deinococcus sp. 6GRE01]
SRHWCSRHWHSFSRHEDALRALLREEIRPPSRAPWAALALLLLPLLLLVRRNR